MKQVKRGYCSLAGREWQGWSSISVLSGAKPVLLLLLQRCLDLDLMEQKHLQTKLGRRETDMKLQTRKNRVTDYTRKGFCWHKRDLVLIFLTSLGTVKAVTGRCRVWEPRRFHWSHAGLSLNYPVGLSTRMLWGVLEGACCIYPSIHLSTYPFPKKIIQSGEKAFIDL